MYVPIHELLQSATKNTSRDNMTTSSNLILSYAQGMRGRLQNVDEAVLAIRAFYECRDRYPEDLGTLLKDLPMFVESDMFRDIQTVLGQEETVVTWFNKICPA
ncbi:hypothetical protein PSACC_02010 [Paramicrosporidium saccamoebae]|uniref:Uncharacterized protein n=1 Tax=Paramicrosporidium saccamoebae TaxID=1246581 RepID=A0A2H9TK87_9FUNG|nr:hypothetical protein PSACC_02010 [Paramicrosporidium saccamoebae]